MKLLHPRLTLFRDEIARVAQDFNLDMNNLVVETYTPNSDAILVETFKSHEFRIHINLQDNRIISVKQLNSNDMDAFSFRKYSVYMK